MNFKALSIKTILIVLVCFLSIQFTYAQGPANLSTDLIVWLKANAGTNTTTNGAGITSWTDQSNFPTRYNATGTGLATYRTNFSNFNPGVSLTDDPQPISSAATISRPNGTASTTFVVGNLSAIADQTVFEIGTNGNRQFFLYERYASNTRPYSLKTSAQGIWTIGDPGGATNANIYEDGGVPTVQTNKNVSGTTNWTTGGAIFFGR